MQAHFAMIFKKRIGNDLKYKHIYLTYVDNYIGAYDPYTGEVVGYKTRDRFVDFVTEILQKYPDYSPHNVINQGIEQIIREKIKAEKLKNLSMMGIER